MRGAARGPRVGIRREREACPAASRASTAETSRRAIEIAPKYAEAWYNLGVAQAREERDGEAISITSETVGKNVADLAKNADVRKFIL